jgi:hypothetical protein
MAVAIGAGASYSCLQHDPEEPMTTAFQPLLSRSAHVAVIAAAFAIISGVVAFAGRASEDAVRNAQVAISPPVRYIVLQPVEVVARRTTGALAEACPTAASRT